MKPFKSKLPIQVRFNDIDILGHVNSAVYFTYFELCRVDYFQGGLIGEDAGVSAVVAKVDMEYKQQVVQSDSVFGSVWVSRLGTKSFDMVFSLQKEEKDGQLIEVARGSATMVSIDIKSMKTIPVPEPWKELFYKSN